MATLVGTQSDFADAMKALIELDYDAVEAYEAAINRLESVSYKEQMQQFKDDHKNHIEELNKILTSHGEPIVTGPDAKQWLTKGKVVLSNLIGDDITILKAMLTNEEDTNSAYEKVNAHEKKWEDAIEVLSKGYQDERRHKTWIKTIIENSNL